MGQLDSPNAVTLIEMFNQGLVTSRDPSLLRPGELQRCNNTVYHPNDQAIWKCPGRTAFNSTAVGSSTSTAKGLRELQWDNQSTAFDGSLIVYIASASGSYYHAPLATTADPPTGTFSLLASAVGNGPTIDTVHYNGRFYVLNGNTDAVPNKVIVAASADGGLPTTRRHGLTPVATSPTLASAAGAGWPSAEQDFGDGYYFFITTEVYDAKGPDEVESTWAGDTADFDIATNLGVILVSGSADGVTVTKPAQVNTEATSWRIYFHGPEPSPYFDFSMLSTFYLIGEESMSVTSKRFGTIVNVQGPSLAASATGVGVDNPNDSLDYGSGAATIDGNGETLENTNFGFATAGIAGGTIYGIELEVNARIDVGLAYLDAQLSWNNGSNYTTAETHRIPVNGGDYRTYKTGSPTDTWGRTWSTAGSTDFVNGAFRTKLTYRPVYGGTPDVDIDWVRAKINYGSTSTGAPINKAGPLFPYVAIQVGPIITTVGANFPPPVASTGDVYEGQMVTNDVVDPSIIRYSLPDGVDYFPQVYFINFETKERDEVTNIRRLGEKLIVGLRHQIYRVNYLPRAEDSEFDRGRCYEAIAENHGIMGTHCSTLFTPPDRPQLLAYVSNNGIHATDGFTTTTLSEDLDWERMVNVSALYKSILVDYPKLYSVVMYYIPAGVTDGATITPTKALWFNYHPSHIKEGGKALVSGPNDVWAASSHVSKFLDKPIMWTGSTDGKVYVEDQGFTDARGNGISVDIVTRDIYAAGIGWEYTLERIWVRHGQHTSPTTTVNYDLYWRNTESEFVHPTAAGTGQWTQKSFTTAKGAPLTGSIANLANGGALSRIDAHAIGESMVHRFTEGNGLNGLRMDYMALEVAGHGLEEKR